MKTSLIILFALFAGFSSLAYQGFKSAAELGRIAALTGDDVEEIQIMRTIAIANGVGSETFDKSLAALIKQAAKASFNGSETFDKLGVQILQPNGSLKKGTQLIEALIRRFDDNSQQGENAWGKTQQVYLVETLDMHEDMTFLITMGWDEYLDAYVHE